MTSSQGDFAQALAGQAQQQTVSVSTQVSTSALKNVDKAGTQQNASIRTALNFIDGTNGAVTVADNSGSDRVDVTVDVASSPTFSGTVTANRVVYNGMRSHRHPYANDRHVESGSVTTPAGSTVAVTFTSAYSSAPNVVAQRSDGGASFVAVTSKSTSGFTAMCFSGGGSLVAGVLDWIAEGT